MNSSNTAHDAQAKSTSEPQENDDNVIQGPWRINDAVIINDEMPADDILDREIELAISPHGAQTRPGRWRKWNTSVRDFLTRLSTHDVGEKDGNCFIAGGVIDGERKAMAIPHLDLLVLDIDVGQRIEDIRARLQELGLFALVHTSHSHLKPVSTVKKDAVVKWLGGGDINPDIEQVKGYLISEKRYQPWVLDEAKILETKHTAEGVMIFVAHQPMPKFRVILLLKERFTIMDRQGTQADGIREWKERYAGASKLLGAFYDRSCVDPSRLFYLPRHPQGAKEYRIEVIAGKPLDLDQVERVSTLETRAGSSDPYALAAASDRGTRDYKTDGMLWFFKKYGDLFDIETFLLETDPDGDRGSRPSGPGRTHRCPNDDAHTNAGDDSDVAFFCVNATEAESGKATAHCRHDSCSQMDRIDFTDLICERVKITSANELMKWVPEVIDELTPGEVGEAPGDKPTYAAYRNIAEVNRAVQSIGKGDKEAGQFVAICLGMSTAIGATQKDEVRKQIAAVSGIAIATLKKEEKAGLAKLATVSDELLDDDTVKMLLELNKEYAVVLLGGKLRIMKRHERGVPPEFLEKDAFNTFLANVKVPVQEATGNVKLVPVTIPWFGWKDRRTYEKVVFEPAGCPDAWCNTYNGLPIDGKPGSWDKLRGHMLDNVCLGNIDYFNWLMTWMAQILQFPADKKGSCVVVIGKKGSGKSKLFDWFREALGDMALKVAHREHVVGVFNSHLGGKLCVVLEEALWAGDKAVEAILKDWVTSKEMLLTLKGIDSVKVKNYSRLALISNESWVVPASLDDERRFFVLRCGDAVRENIPFFEAIDEEMENGGLEAMIHELMHWVPPYKLGWNELRKPPVTPWLKEQGEHGLSPAHLFVEHLVETLEWFPGKAGHFHYYRVGKPMTHAEPPEEIGGIDFDPDDKTTVKGADLQAEFNAWAKEYGISNRGTKGGASFSDTLERDFGIVRKHTEHGKVYVFPPIADLRLKLGHVNAPADSLTQADLVEKTPSHPLSD